MTRAIANSVERLITQFGSEIDIVGRATPSDPITGAGGSAGATRSAIGVFTNVDFDVFDSSRVQVGDRQIVFAQDANVQIGETIEARTVAEVEKICPNGETVLAYIALIRG